jgi:hypothetical protein
MTSSTVTQIHSIPLARVTEEGFWLFADDRARLGAHRINFNDPVDLMTALIVFKRECATVFSPLHP